MPLSAGPFSTSPTPGSERIADQGPTYTRIVCFDPTACRGSNFTPSPSSAASTIPHDAPPSTHSTATSGACPSQPVVNGGGHEPTTAGTCSDADQSCRSHHTFSPPSSDASAAPTGDSTPFR